MRTSEKTAAAIAAALLAGGLAACSTPQAGPEALPAGNAAQGTTAAGAQGPGGTAGAAGSTSAQGASGASQAPSPSAPPAASGTAGSCQGLMTQFDAALAATKGACSADTDCACYPDLRMDGKLGVTDAATAATLASLSNQYRKQQCPTMFVATAGPAKCNARCTSGACR